MTLYLHKNSNGTFSVDEKMEGILREMFDCDFVSLLTFAGHVPMTCVYERVQTLFGCRKLVLDF